MAVPAFRLVAACLVASLFAAPALAQVRISQVYGAGGNSGAPLKNDYIELFNAGTSEVDLAGWSVQYASSTGTTWQATALSGTLQPGQYLLVQEAAGANALATPLPTPDNTGTIAMAAGAGKVALRDSTTLLSGICPAEALDLVGYGSANCAPNAPTISATLAAFRKGAGCTESGDNSADFEALAPAPRNRATAAAPCGGGGLPTDPSLTVAASPSTVVLGETVLVTATVVPGTNPASTGIVVLADLSVLGGDAAQRLRDEGTDGDLVAGDGVYSYGLEVTSGASGSAHLVPIGVGDAEGRTDAATLSITVATLVPIHAIQGSGNLSPFTGHTVVTEGIVTARRSNGFYLQTPFEQDDANQETSEGIFVFTSSAPTVAATVGNRVRVQGKVAEFVPASNPHQLTITELTAPVLSVISTGNSLPDPVILHVGDYLRADSLDSMERLEGMRVAADLVVVAPGGAFINEASATSPADGVFYTTLAGVARPMREPGVSVLDTTPFPAGVTPPVFDSNPERLRVQSTGQTGALAIAVDVGDRVDGLVGVIDYAFGAYNLLPDPSSPTIVHPGATPRAVTPAAADEIAIGGFNLLRFFDDVNAASISDPVLTPTALQNRLRKTANAICGYVGAPDILGVVEVENLDVLQRLADTINAGDTQEPGACARNPQYVAILLEGNDVGGIDVGFLVSTAEVGGGTPRVEVLDIQQLGKDATLANPDGSTSLLNDRPSLLLRARVHHANGASRELAVIVNHLRSLSDANSMDPGTNGWATAGARVRAKRAEQARFLGEVVQQMQEADPNERLVLLGDFNAFEFNDGYVDSMGILGGDAADAGSVLTHVPSPVTRPLVNLSSLMPEAERYSFSFDGNAQSLDHLLVSQSILDQGFGVRGEHARINADFGEDNFGDWTVPVRVSDHDPVVLFLRDEAFATADVAVSVQANATDVVPGATATFGVGVANGGPDAAALARVAMRIDSADAPFSVDAPAGWTCFAPVADGTDGQRIDCATGSLANAGTAGFAVSVVAPAPGGRALSLRASASTSVTDPAQGNNLAEASVAITATADVAVAVDANASSVRVGQDAVFGVGVGNGAATDAQSAVLDLELSAALAGVQVDAAAGWTCDAPVTTDRTRVHCTAATLAAGTQAGFTVRAPAPDALGNATLALAATLSSATVDPDASNNASAASVAIEAVADLATHVVAPKSPQKSTRPAVFGVGVANAGPDTARAVVVVLNANVPANAWMGLSAPGWTCAAGASSATSSQQVCRRDAMASAASSSITVTLFASTSRQGGSLILASAVAGASTDAVAGNDTATASVKVVGK
jgi:predicted extracellular nuclease